MEAEDQKKAGANTPPPEKPEGNLRKILKLLVLFLSGGGAIYLYIFLYQLGKDNGQTKYEREKIQLQEENNLLKKDTCNLNTRILKLKNDSLGCIAVINKLHDFGNPKDQQQEQKRKVSFNRGGTKKSIAQIQEKPIAPQPTRSSEERIEALQRQIDYYSEQNKNLIDENDSYKSEVSLMRQKLQRARELNQQVKLESNQDKRDVIEKQRDEILSAIESKMKKLSPDIPSAMSTKSDTVTTVKIVSDYAKLGDDSYNKAKELDDKLRNKPDSYFLGIVKNKTKADLIQPVLDSYNSALEYYKLVPDMAKVKVVEEQISSFKNTFSRYLPK